MAEAVWTKCNACGADSFVPLSKVEDWQIGKCAQCGMIFVNPIPFFPPAQEFSDMSADFQYTRYMYNITPAIIEYEQNQFRQQTAVADQFRGHNHSLRRFLDIGCGSGAGVRAASDLGWEATGIDLDPKLIGIGKKELNVDLRCSPLLESQLENGCYSFIRLRDVIEHLPNPYDVLRRVYELLAPGGVLLIVTPNEDGLPTQLRLRMGKPRNVVATVAPPHHLHGFTPHTLRLILERAGFKRYQLGTTTPVDAAYVTSNNMRSSKQMAKVLFWQTAKVLGTGSMLYGWTVKPES